MPDGSFWLEAFQIVKRIAPNGQGASGALEQEADEALFLPASLLDWLLQRCDVRLLVLGNGRGHLEEEQFKAMEFPAPVAEGVDMHLPQGPGILLGGVMFNVIAGEVALQADGLKKFIDEVGRKAVG